MKSDNIYIFKNNKQLHISIITRAFKFWKAAHRLGEAGEWGGVTTTIYSFSTSTFKDEYKIII